MDKISLYIIDVDDTKHTIETVLDSDLNLMEAVRNAGFSIGNCGGMALCASCHCYIEDSTVLGFKTEIEEDMLDQLHNSKLNSRLICQIPLSQKLNGITLVLKK